MRTLLLPVLLVPLSLQGDQQDLRKAIEDTAANSRWIWNDFARARKEAEKNGKPIFALFRCVP